MCLMTTTRIDPTRKFTSQKGHYRMNSFCQDDYEMVADRYLKALLSGQPKVQEIDMARLAKSAKSVKVSKAEMEEAKRYRRTED
jgi:hypothetical protein